MSRRSPNTRPPSGHSISNSTPLISVSTITYIASWRGQLLICTIILVIGAIYFIIRQPIADYLRRRREEISRAHQQELMKLETEKEVPEPAPAEKDKTKERVREKKKEKDLKKRKGSMLRVTSGTESSLAGPSSLESSPAPTRLGVPSSAKKTPSRSRSPSPSPLNTPLRLPPSTPEPRRASATTPRIRLREPTSDSVVVDVDETPKSVKSIKSMKPRTHIPPAQNGPSFKETNVLPEDRSQLLPEQIPLPESPDSHQAGPSRHWLAPSEAGDMSDTTSNASEFPSSRPKAWTKSEGFSIMPDEGYLPPLTPVTNSKKKKKKARQSQPEPSSLVPSKHDAPSQSPEPTRRGHTRQDSVQISRPVNATSAEYEAHIDRMEVIVDRLRGELGAAMASGRLAREAEEEARQNEEQIRAEMEAVKQRSASSEKIRSREADLSHHLDQARRHSNKLMKRVTELEGQLSHNGAPPSSPFMLMGPPSPFPQMNGHNMFPGNMSPMPGSPYNMAFPSPGLGGSSRGGIPHHSMYPSPSLHPNSHAFLMNAAHGGNMNMGMNMNMNGNGQHLQTPSQFRRTSTSDTSNDVFAGPLTPGIPSSAPSPYPYELGHGLPPIPMSMIPAMEGDLQVPEPIAMTPQERRTSIEASVMRKKSGHLISQQDGQDGPEAIQEEKDDVVGLGIGDVELGNRGNGGEGREDGQQGDDGNENEEMEDDLRSSLSPPNHFGNSNSNSSNPPTPSPQSRLLTPSQLHHVTLAEEISSTPSHNTGYGQVKIGHDSTPPSASTSVSEGGTNITRPPSPITPLWASSLTDGQIAQRKHLAAMREKREAERRAKEGKENLTLATPETVPENKVDDAGGD